ncbi:response regulator transcription factor [Pseudomonas sp. EL_65y_Pfl2_R96]|uniref:response regulator transcription factor n=1 Tax=Pseudomonas sp. EL_65y_Pfl2_R96 TaxID=3088699 RepID=UPI0030D727E8
MYKALVVDDHPFIRSSVKMLLKQEQFEVVAEADNGADAVQMARELEPDLIILDISMPKLDGLEVISRISALGVSSKILVLTSQSALFYSMRCMKAGAAGYISKTNELDELVKAIKAVMSGYTFFPNLATSSVRRSDVEATDLELIQSLSDRELTILQQLSNGLSNKEIGDSMLLSNKTVSTYKTRLIEKLNVKSVVYLADFAKRNNLI